MSDVVLLSMPYHAIERPNLALGILCAKLREAGISVAARHPNLDWGARVGLDNYVTAQTTFSALRIAELTFTEAAFRERAPAFESYLSDILERTGSAPLRIRVRKVFHHLRSRASAFIDELAHDIVERGARVVGCSSMFDQHVASLAILRRIKELAPDVVTMMGGPNVEGVMGQATVDNFGWVDFAVSGEADELAVELFANAVERGRSIPRLPEGVLRRNPFRVAGETLPRAQVADMASVPVPDFDDYFAELERAPFRRRVRPGLTVETSRGCWYGQKKHCTFCGQNGMSMKYRSKAPERALAEFRGLYERYRCSSFGVVDNILDLRYFDEVLPELERDEVDYRLFYELKPNMRRAQLEQLAKAGVLAVLPGFESLDDELLGLMGKGTSAAINVQILKWAGDLGIYVHWIFLYSIPGETNDAYRRMAELVPRLAHLQPPNIGTEVEFHRFSPYVNTPERWGLELKPHEIYKSVYPIPESEMARLAYYFEDHSGAEWGRMSSDKQRFIASMQAWTEAHRSVRPVLTIDYDPNGGARLVDTRPCRAHDELELDPIETALYRLLDSVKGQNAIMAEGTRLGLDQGEVHEILRRFDDAKIVAHTNGRWVALANVEPKPANWLDYKLPHGLIVADDVDGARPAVAGTVRC